MSFTSTHSKQKQTFEQFLEQSPDDGRYELVDGKIVRIAKLVISGIKQYSQQPLARS